MGNGASGGNGDPSPAFDAKFGTAHMAQLSAAQAQSVPNAGHINVSVSTSYDGGVTWKPPVTVAVGHASIGPSANGVFLDKEWLVADNYPSSPHYGRLYLSWDQIELSKGVVPAVAGRPRRTRTTRARRGRSPSRSPARTRPTAPRTRARPGRRALATRASSPTAASSRTVTSSSASSTSSTRRPGRCRTSSRTRS